MKISKVNHTRTGVGVDNNGPRGIVYTDPSNNSVLNQEERIRQRVKESNRLYNVFGSIFEENEQGKKIEIPNDLSKIFNNIIKDCIKQYSSNAGNLTIKFNSDELIKRTKTKLNGIYQDESYKEKLDEALYVRLKKTLRTPKTIETLNLLFEKSITGAKFSDDDKQMIQEYLVDCIIKDYNKISFSNNALKSLKNQNLVAQPTDKNGQIVISLSNSSKNNSKVNEGSIRLTKKQEKEALSKFLEEYAVLDKSVRDGKLRVLRRLVDLYFYGIDQVNKNDDFSVWNRHEEAKNNNDKIVDFERIDRSGLEPDLNDTKEEKTEKNKKIRIINKTEDAILNEKVRDWNCDRYRESMRVVDNDTIGLFFDDKNISKFFIHHIENEVERILKNKTQAEFKLQLGYVSEKVWKGIINFLCIKYISIGKMVYNFAMQDVNKASGDVNVGIIGKDFEKGISSFELEKISAKETLQRETAVYVSFAAHNLSRAVLKDEVDDDLMSIKKEKLSEKLDKDNIVRNIFQYFGGLSTWKDFDKSFLTEEKNQEIFLDDIKTIILQLRNESFHFSTEKKVKNISNANFISDMFRFECRKACVIEKNKFYSNNLPLFYSEESLDRVLRKLYSKYTDRKSQVPAFERVIKRCDIEDCIRELGIKASFNKEDSLKFESAVYYLLKQIYYNDFLASKEDAKKIFINNIESKIIRKDDRGRVLKDDSGVADFQKRLKEIESFSLSEICQIYMNDYNQQNNQLKKKTKKNEEIYQHYKLGLYNFLKEALIIYIKNNNNLYGFIKSPHIKSEGKMIDIENFLPKYTSNQYKDLADKLEESFELKKWYIMTRFLNPKQTNQLVGALRNYIQYIESIKRRASETNNRIDINNNDLSMVKDIIRVVDMCTRICGSTSNDLNDYFDSSEDYAAYLEKYLDYEYKDGLENRSAMLGTFCMEKNDGKMIGLYYDGTNPILNRNVVLSKIYGADSLISKAVPRVNRNLLNEYLNSESSIANYKKSGECKTSDDQSTLRKYQELKNRVEFRDIVEYTEIINELKGQLVNWAFIRERDLMYFQLGFHYQCYNNRSTKPEAYKTIEVQGKNNETRRINGAILYQIVAMYTYGMDLYYRGHEKEKDSSIYVDSKNKWEVFNGQISSRVSRFTRYSGYIQHGDQETFKESDDIYLSGLELFEVIEEHDDIVKLRNDIDHFNYYKYKKCILDYYSEIFDRFFTYDMKYQKNVVNTLYNILASYHLIARFDFCTGYKNVGKQKKSCASIRLSKQNGLKSDNFTYKIADNKEVNGPARLSGYVKNVMRILYYPEKPDVEMGENIDKFKEKGGGDKRDKKPKNTNKKAKKE